jgi:hypothetical protein
MAMYFSCELLRSRFQIACSKAARRRRRMAEIGIQEANVP